MKRLVELGPFDVFAWQLLWVFALYCGQRLYEKEDALPLSKPPALGKPASTILVDRTQHVTGLLLAFI
jgi:hypothetical protein